MHATLDLALTTNRRKEGSEGSEESQRDFRLSFAVVSAISTYETGTNERSVAFAASLWKTFCSSSSPFADLSSFASVAVDSSTSNHRKTDRPHILDKVVEGTFFDRASIGRVDNQVLSRSEKREVEPDRRTRTDEVRKKWRRPFKERKGGKRTRPKRGRRA